MVCIVWSNSQKYTYFLALSVWHNWTTLCYYKHIFFRCNMKILYKGVVCSRPEVCSLCCLLSCKKKLPFLTVNTLNTTA